MATGTYAPDPFEQMCDDNGDPLSSGTLTTYAAGTSTPATTYSDVTLLTANTNPISLDAAGRPTSGAIFLTPGTSYKFVLKDVLGATVATRDNIAAVPLNPNVTGTWIPVIGGNTSTTGQSYSFQSGIYTKIGALVIASFHFQLTAKGTMTGVLSIQGLPFVCSSALGVMTAPITFWIDMVTAFVSLNIFTQDTTRSAILTGLTAAGVNSTINLTAVDVSDTCRMAGTIIYTTTS